MPVSTSISTRQASDLLGVHESSVKRWCNAGDLGCEYTHGGHRRIPLAELLRFAEARSIEVA
ncbi:MAG: helix-turn-helix domain-containing protein, partial [Bacteroidota bacterium]